MSDGLKKATLPRVVAVYWAQPTEDGKARYVVDFESNLEPAHVEALNRLLRRTDAFLGADAGPASNQATVFVSNSDADRARLDWLKDVLRPQVVGTVIADLYVETKPLTSRLRALGDVEFTELDLAVVEELPGVASVRLVGGERFSNQMEVVFDQQFADTTDVPALFAGFMGLQEFVLTMVPVLGSPPA